MIKAILVDDEIHGLDTLGILLAEYCPEVQIIDRCSSAKKALDSIAKAIPDLLFLDIEMPGMTGLELTKNLGNKGPVIIFTTSKKEYAAEAFELNVADYIVKPVTPARFIQAVDKAREVLQSRIEDYKISDDEFLFIRDSNIVRKLNLDDILFAEAMGDYVKLHTIQKFFAIHTTLKAVEERLPASRFLRVHRSYIVAISKIDSVQDGALVINGKPVPVADTYRSSLNKRMNIL